MCKNECISEGICRHNEECYDDLCFTSEQLKVVDRWLADEKAKTIDECKNEFLQAIQDCIDEHGERFFMSNIKDSFADIAEQMKEQKNE